MRTTTDPKEYVIRARVNEEMYLYITKQAENRHIKASDVIRELITKGMRS